MSDERELEPIEAREAKEVLKVGIEAGESLLRLGIESLGQYRYWASAAHIALEPLPDHQEHFDLKCWQKRGPVYFQLREGIHLLRQALRAMEDREFNLDAPSLQYRRLVGSIPD